MDILSFAYAFAVTAGGTLGYVKAGSVVSLVMGLIFGGVSAIGAYHISLDPSQCTVLLVSSSVLGGIMSYRALHTGKFMPAGIVAILSILMVIRLLPRFIARFSPSN